MSFDLLIKIPFKGYSLNDFAADLQTLIQYDKWEHRQNPGAEGYYYRMYVMGVGITASLAEDARFKEYTLGIRFEPEIPQKEDRLNFSGLADCLARKLTVDGFEVMRPFRSEEKGEAMHYFQNPDKNSRLWKPFIAEIEDPASDQQYDLPFAVKS
jgi:hypothetical protein